MNGRWKLHHRRREALNAYLMLSPWLIGILVFVAGPMIASFVISFMDWPLFMPPVWVGFENFSLLFKDPLFYTSLYNTAIYTLVGVPLQITTALIMAFLLNQRVKGLAIFRSLFYMPSVTPAVAVAVIWLWIYNPDYGLANALLSAAGLPKLEWLWHPSTSKWSLILMSTWTVGTPMIILVAGLQGIPQSLYEAAEIDGASPLRKVWSVTLPLLTPAIFLVTVMQLIWSFQVFTLAYVTTNGGPQNSTLFYVLYLFRHGFEYFQMGYASAMAWVLFAIIMLATWIQLRLSKRWVHYEGEIS